MKLEASLTSKSNTNITDIPIVPSTQTPLSKSLSLSQVNDSYSDSSTGFDLPIDRMNVNILYIHFFIYRLYICV